MDIDEELLATLDRSAQREHLSRNQLIVNSLEASLRDLKRREIDCAFAEMADDPDYCDEMIQIERELCST